MLNGLKETYRDYCAWVMQYQQSEALQQKIMHFVLGNRDFHSRPEHTQFYHDVEVQAKTMLNRLREGGEDSSLLASALRYVFVDCYAGMDKKSTLMFLVTEQLFVPHMELLKREDADSLYALYKQQRKKDPGLAVQSKILKRLKQLGARA